MSIDYETHVCVGYEDGHPVYKIDGHARSCLASAGVACTCSLTQRILLAAAKEKVRQSAELLCVIHSDGGHCISDHGWEKACKNAESKYYRKLEALEAAHIAMRAIADGTRALVRCGCLGCLTDDCDHWGKDCRSKDFTLCHIGRTIEVTK